MAYFADILGLGRPQRSAVNRFVNLHCRLARFESHKNFLRDCVDHALVPKGLRLRLQPFTSEDHHWKKEAEKRRVVSAAAAARRVYYQARDEMEKLRTEVVSTLPGHLRTVVTQTAKKAFYRSLQDIIATKERKFTALLLEDPLVFFSRRPQTPDPGGGQTVVNLSRSPLSLEEKQLLSRHRR